MVPMHKWSLTHLSNERRNKVAMSDCGKCYNTPCTCGWRYRNWSMENLHKLSMVITYVRNFKRMNPDAIFSTFDHNPMTEDDKKLLEYFKFGR